MLPSFYSELFTLYLLLHEREDRRYSQGIASLSLFPDTQLLEHLDVQRQLWPREDLTLTTNQRHSLVSATECLQKIIITVDPREKQEALERTYEEIEATVSQALGQEHKLPMDDLLPLLIYVVSRARIQHLGAELHLTRDMMDPNHTGGRYDFLLTALESCYQHIQRDGTTRIDCPPAGTPGSPGSSASPGPGVVPSRPRGLPGCEQAQTGPCPSSDSPGPPTRLAGLAQYALN
ncbi:ALS2 C-terminal-like protein [Myotis lucifugus]|uniref:ALS2 C-terminal-like protein n=1 Tax=Myotis lucifugus TaxID=59463 RepID=UPI000CCC8A93|nr:ALS2 C-terminal-like protein [Myotis lucifugus]